MADPDIVFDPDMSFAEGMSGTVHSARRKDVVVDMTEWECGGPVGSVVTSKKYGLLAGDRAETAHVEMRALSPTLDVDVAESVGVPAG